MKKNCTSHTKANRKACAFTLLEAMLMVTLLGIVYLGVGVGLQSTVNVPSKLEQRLAIHSRLVEKLEDLSTLDFGVLSANSGLSDTVTVQSRTYNRTVTVAAADANGGGVDSDFLEVTVAIDGQSLKTRFTKP